MEKTIFLSQLMGPVLVVLGVSAIVFSDAMMKVVKELFESFSLRYVMGIIEMTAGLAIALSHNIWSDLAALLVSLIGWAMVVEGSFWLLLPNFFKLFHLKLRNSFVIVASGVFGLAIGIYLSYFGYLA